MSKKRIFAALTAAGMLLSSIGGLTAFAENAGEGYITDSHGTFICICQ